MLPTQEIQRGRTERHPIVPPQLVGLLTSFRLLIALLLLVMLNLQWLNQPGTDHRPGLYLTTLLIYAVTNTTLLSVALTGRLRVTALLLFCLAMLDILCLNLLIQANAHQARSLSLLFILAIVASASALPVRLSMLVAAMAALSVLIQELARVLSQAATSDELVTAGTLGLVFFSTAWAVQRLFQRAANHEHLARQQAADIIELQRLNACIVHQMRTGILVIDEQGQIRLINEAARLLLQLETQADELVGHRIPTTLSTTWRRWHDNPQQLPPPFRVNACGPELRASFTPLQRRDEAQSLVFLEDMRLITQQAQALKLASLGRLTGSIAHEVRNPLGAISHAAQLLGESGTLAADDQHLCQIIRAQSSRVNQVIENVLALSRRAPIRSRLIDLNRHIEAFVKAYHNRHYEQPQIRYRGTGGELLVKFDPPQLDQVLTNLFDNGLRHSWQATGQATLTVRTQPDPNSQLPQLDIIDQGSGIREADLPEIFEPFYTTQSSGTGLGLYLAREICEAQQTQLSYLRTPQQQSCFRLIFAHPRKRWVA